MGLPKHLLHAKIYEFLINCSWKLLFIVLIGYFVVSGILMFVFEANITVAEYVQYFFMTIISHNTYEPLSVWGAGLDKLIVILNYITIIVFFTKMIEDINHRREERDLGKVQLNVKGAIYVFGYRKETRKAITRLFDFMKESNSEFVLVSEDEERNPFHRKDVHFVRGSLSSNDVMTRSCVKNASVVIIWADTDGETLQIGASVGKALYDAKNFDAYVVPYFEEKDSALNLETFYENIFYGNKYGLECIHSLIINVLVQTVKNPGFFKIIKGLIEDPSNIMELKVPDNFRKKKFGDLLCSFKDIYGALLLGIMDNKNHKVTYNPDGNTIIKPGMSLIYLNDKIVKKIDWKKL